MNGAVSKYCFYYPATFLKGEMQFKYIEQYEKFQYQPLENIRNFQKYKLLELLQYVVREKPFYQKLYSGIDFHEMKKSSLEELMQRLPSIDKTMLINNISDMTAHKPFLSSSKTTGGSTGEPVVLYKNADALARERVATARSYRWAGIEVGDMQARFWGVPHQRKGQLKARLTDLLANRCRLSAFDLSEESFSRYYKEMRDRKPKYLYGYVSAIRVFSEFIAKNSLPSIDSVQAIITTSEVLSDADRSLFEGVWGVKVYNEYGCGEVGSIAHECDHGHMHLMADNLIVEVDALGGFGGQGELVVTDLHNRATPLIRYRLGDFGELSNEVCPCGRSLPILNGIYGRAYDLIETPEGKCLHPEAVIYIFERMQSESRVISQFQVVQALDNSFLINIVAGQGFSHRHEGLLLEGFRKHISPTAKVSICLVSEILREKSGKLRLVKRIK